MVNVEAIASRLEAIAIGNSKEYCMFFFQTFLGARTLLGAPGRRATRNKKLLGAPGIATRSKMDLH